jgi:hypothetical protein
MGIGAFSRDGLGAQQAERWSSGRSLGMIGGEPEPEKMTWTLTPRRPRCA